MQHQRIPSRYLTFRQLIALLDELFGNGNYTYEVRFFLILFFSHRTYTVTCLLERRVRGMAC